jgi:hypothetical protein
VTLSNPAGGGGRAPVADVPAGAEMTLTPEAAPPAGGGAKVRLDDGALRARGPWARRGGLSVAHARGAVLSARGVRARTIALAVSTGPRSGSVQVVWRGRVLRTVSLRTAMPGRRAIRVARFGRVRTGTLKLRATSARRVAIDGVLIGR